MGFVGVYRAVYDYTPAADGELEITEGDLLLILEKSTDDDWWRAKKKATSDDEDEPEGLVPNNYVEEAQPISKAKAIYDYAHQTEEEISFSEDAQLSVYDTSDPEWTLVGHNGDYGFAPANYIEVTGAAAEVAPPPLPKANRPAAQPAVQESEDEDSRSSSPVRNPAKALAGIIAQRTGGSAPAPTAAPEPASPSLPQRGPATTQFTPEESEDEAPPQMPRRPPSQVMVDPRPRKTDPPGVMTSPPYNREVSGDHKGSQPPAGGYKLYSIHEMVSSLGKNKKVPITLGINLARGMIMLAPAKSKDGPQQEWTAEKLSHYSIEGKHVFVELVRPSKSADFHAGAKDTAQEIVAQLGELAGASRAEGLKEVIAASTGGSGQKKGHMLYEFMAQGDDEVTVAVGDEIIVLDDTRSEEWWMVRRLKNGKEGVVPSSYVEITGTLPVRETPSASNHHTGRSVVEQNRLEEERATKEALKKHRKKESEDLRRDDGNGVRLPARESSLATKESEKRSASSKKRREDKELPKPRPDTNKIRTWTDRSGAFRVEAEFLGLKDNKIHLHKDNGVKIAVPVSKMAVEDLEYVEKITGVSLDEDKPLSDIKRRNTLRDKERQAKAASNGITTAPEYDWFDFFLACGVNPQICERYAQVFARDQMGQETLPDVTPALLRTLGLKEGDILRVMKHLDNKFGRVNGAPIESDPNATGGLFSGPGGALRNNTRKGRPAPAVETNNNISADTLLGKPASAGDAKVRTPSPSSAAATPSSPAPPPLPKDTGFDDDAWSVKPIKSPAQASGPTKPPTPAPASASSTATTPASATAPKLTGSANELSLLSPALEPTPAPLVQAQAAPIQTQAQGPAAQAPPPAPAKPAADPAFFDQLGAPATQNILAAQPTGRARPNAPALNTANSLIAPPPRSASAPGFTQQQQQPQSAFSVPSPLSAQLTGYQQPMQTGYQAPPGQSLANLQQQRTMSMLPPQQMPYIQNGILPQQTGYPAAPMMQAPQMTGFYPQQQQQQQSQFAPLQPQPTASPFADPPRPPFQPTATGFVPNGYGGATGGLPPALTPMRTGYSNGTLQPQQTGFGGYQQQQQQQQQPPMPPIPPQQYPPGMMQNGGFGAQQQQQQQGVPAPLVPQKTGPAPPVKFGVTPGLKPLVATPTGRRANLSNATPQNPFGF